MRDTPEWLEQARSAWTHRGQKRPSFALEPGAGQESVWDYPRPPAIVADGRSVTVTAASGALLIETSRAVRVLETASPPTYYLPDEDLFDGALEVTSGSSFCEWKGEATYLSVAGDPQSTPVAWRYDRPLAGFEQLLAHTAFYPARVQCTVDGEAVRAQAGGFYGGWVTDEIVGPYKGEPGTGSW